MINRLITGEPSSATDMWRTGNPVGSRRTIPGSVEEAYFVGLWRADGYTWSSSIGVSNTDYRLAERTAQFLAETVGSARVRWRVYIPKGADAPVERLRGRGYTFVVRPASKARQVAYHVYINHRPYLRQVRGLVAGIDQWPAWAVWPYFAGRFDGDGSVAATGRWGARIAYGSSEEAEADQRLLAHAVGLEARVYRFRAARMSVLYILRRNTAVFLSQIRSFSIKRNGALDPVETDSPERLAMR